MKKCTTFQCLLKPLTKKLVAEGVKRFDADRYNKEFKVWDHLIAMIYAQIHQIKSLRELEVAFNSQYGIRGLIEMKKLKRSTLSDANARRSADYFLWIAQHLMSILPRKMRKELGKVIKLLDSSPWGHSLVEILPAKNGPFRAEFTRFDHVPGLSAWADRIGPSGRKNCDYLFDFGPFIVKGCTKCLTLYRRLPLRPLFSSEGT